MKSLNIWLRLRKDAIRVTFNTWRNCDVTQREEIVRRVTEVDARQLKLLLQLKISASVTLACGSLLTVGEILKSTGLEKLL